jgi:solute carrier family 25 iron transporter 28/37
MNVPFTAVQFSTYETVKRLLDKSGENEGFLTQIVAGGSAGALSAACTNPLDVLKTRLQTDGMLQHQRGRNPTSMVSCFPSSKPHG